MVIDRSAFLKNDGPAIRARGEALRLIVARSSFEGPAPVGYIDLAPAGPAARGYPAPEKDEPARDVLGTGHPTDIRILENRFAPCAAPAIAARGTAGLWVERNDFIGATHSALALEGPAAGLMLADNRMSAAAAAPAPLVRLADAALVCAFRNSLEPAGQPALQVSGRFGGILVAVNNILPGSAETAARAAIDLDPSAPFLTATLMLNTIRGPFSSGIAIHGKLPRLFLFDNHLFGMTDWSVESRVVQPSLTSLNNWSPQQSLNLTLAERENQGPRISRYLRRRLREIFRRPG